jgi:hypothetical protein
VSRGNVSCHKILTKAAMGLIHTREAAGMYVDREGKLEPPYMPPSVDPESYSKVRASDPQPVTWLTVQSGAPYATTLGAS